jgi:hypothetical protein
MSAGDEGELSRRSNRRKDGKPYKEGNTREDGSFAVGKNRPPEGSRFRPDDGRARGRRPKGVRSADTEFEKELKRKITIKEDGKPRRVTKSKGVDLRLIDIALRGDTKAIDMVDVRRRRIADTKEEARRYHTLADHEILDRYLQQRAAELNIPPGEFGDLAPEKSEGEPDG